jgi:hypothetical protein
MHRMYESLANDRMREELERAASRRLASAMVSHDRWRRLAICASGMASFASRCASYSTRRAARSQRRANDHSVASYQLVG